MPNLADKSPQFSAKSEGKLKTTPRVFSADFKRSLLVNTAQPFEAARHSADVASAVGELDDKREGVIRVDAAREPDPGDVIVNHATDIANEGLMDWDPEHEQLPDVNEWNGDSTTRYVHTISLFTYSDGAVADLTLPKRSRLRRMMSL